MKKVKIRLSKGEIFNLYEGLKNMPSYAHSDFQYAKHRTLKFLESEYSALFNMKKEAMDKGKKYDEEIHEYLLTICNSDAIGRPKAYQQNGLINYDIQDGKQEEAVNKTKQLKEKFKAELEEREILLKSFNEILLDDSEDKKVNVFVCQIKYTQEISNLNIGNDMEYAYVLLMEKPFEDDNSDADLEEKKD